MRKKINFNFKNQLCAYGAFITSPRPKTTVIIGFWLNEFIRGQKDDSNWINLVIRVIGLESKDLKFWFAHQKSNPDKLWSQKDLDLIIHYSDIICDYQNKMSIR